MERIYLVPGFFGFANLGELRYFGHVHRLLTERLLQAGVEAVVHDVHTLPTASLKRRTERLVETVAATAGPDDRLHVIGHSSGGLDARLFASPGVQLDVEVESFAARLASVVTVATPHRGTPSAASFNTMAGKRLLKLLSLMTMVVVRRGRIPVQVMLEMTKLVRRFDDLLEEGPGMVDELFAGLLAELTDQRRDEIVAFFNDVGEDQALLAQIAPEGMELFNLSTGDRPSVRYGSVVTRARRPQVRGFLFAGVNPYAQTSHALYMACHRMAEGRGPEDASALSSLRGRWADLSAADNDAMVPTGSQVWGETIATADADHLDVIGHFAGDGVEPPHYDWIRTGTGYSRADFEATWGEVVRFMLASRT